LSEDGIVFDELKYREPERLRRPDRDRRWACLAYEVPGPDDLPVFLDRRTADAIERHALRDTSVELGGILLGKECLDDETGQPFVWVTESLEAKHYENTQASFTYTHDSWEEITRERDRLHPDLDVVGWYHTHPDFGIFLSGHDQFIHHNFFAQRLQVAYVVDPVRQTRGFFQWRDGQLPQVGGFFLTADRGDRIALSRLVNDLENIPNTDGGGGLSPRLEAELIAMLTRPQQPHVTTADRAQTAALFAMLGVTAGVLMCAAGLWLNTLSNQVHDQSETLKQLEKTVNQTADAHRVTLDTLFREASAGGAERFVKDYASLAREREDAVRKLDDQKLINETLATRARRLDDSSRELRKDLEKYKKDAEKAKDADELLKRVASLEKRNDELNGKKKQLDDLLDTIEGRDAAEKLSKYKWAWWGAVSGWGSAILLALGLIAAYAAPRIPPEDQAGTVAPPPAPEDSPHRIS
jgi:proteasome lid subunit RPN8/RPN11